MEHIFFIYLLCHAHILCVSAAAENMDVSDMIWELALSLSSKKAQFESFANFYTLHVLF